MSTSAMSHGPTAAGHTPWRVVVAWVAAALTPVVVSVGFVLGYVIGLDPTVPNPIVGWDAAWRVVILWLVVVSASVLGMAFAWSARRHGERSALAAAAVNAVIFVGLTLMTLVGGLVDAFG